VSADSAPAPRDTTYVVAPVVIEAPRPDTRADYLNRSGFVARVDLTARRGRVEDLSTVLSTVVGVNVTQYGGLGSFATASIRGSSSSHVRTYLDGMPIDDPWLGVTNLGDLPLGNLERVEVYRGFSPPQLGGSAIGGAVNLVTRRDDGRDGLLSGLEANLSGGSFETRRENASLWIQPGAFRVFAHLGHERSQGDFAFLDDNATPFNPDDDAIATRANNAFEGWTGMARVARDIGGAGEMSLAYHDLWRENGVPGYSANPSLTANSERRRRIGQLRFEGTPRWNQQLLWWADGFYQHTTDRYRDHDADQSLIAQDTDNRILNYGGNARVRWLMPWLPVALDGALMGNKETFHPVNNLPQHREGPDRWRRGTVLSSGADIYLFGQSLVLTGTWRREHYQNEFYDAARFPWLPPSPQGRVSYDADAPSAGARWQARSWLALKGNVGRYYRVPTFLELFGNTGSVTGNATLEPERGVNRDAGIVIETHRPAWGSLVLEAGFFDNTAENLILFFPNSQHTSQPVNIGSARLRGWELSAAATIARRVDVAASYTRLDTEDTSAIPYYRGNELPSRPQHDVNTSIAGNLGPLRLTYELDYLSANWLDRANLTRTPSRSLHSALAAARLPVPGLTFTLEGRNLTDDRTADVAGYPLPGRAFFSTLSYQY
jgi:iron complex outermembrane receptor protein